MRKVLLWACGLATLLALAVPGFASADRAVPGAIFRADDTQHPSLAVLKGTLPIIVDGGFASQRQLNALRAAAVVPATIGETRFWVGLDDFYGTYYAKRYVLRAIGANAELWVASDAFATRGGSPSSAPQLSSGVNFLDGDCRNGDRTVVSDAQATYLVDQFDNNILPKESVVFSVAPPRDGTNPLLGPPFDPAGDGNKTVILVDNVRDTNFYDFGNTQGFSYIAGFFSTQLNAFFDRNVMTIDGFDWLHRTGANPPDNPVAGNLCTSAPARPSLYEGVFAHEYQHLLESYQDPNEVNWVNEGLSDWAMSFTGYAHPQIPITQKGFDSHIQTFLGWTTVAGPFNPNPATAGGPENSLTRWGDQGDGEILADYGAAYSMMTYLHDRFGDSFMSALHRDPGTGLVGLQDVLDTVGRSAGPPPRGHGRDFTWRSSKHDDHARFRKLTAFGMVYDWSLTVAVDGLLDDGARLSGDFLRPSDLSATNLDATLNWDSPEAYSTPGAPSNGSDYVRLRDGSGHYQSGRQIHSISFRGAKTLPPKPLAWTVDANPPGQPGNAALYSGFGNNRDEFAIKQVTVPAGSPSLTFRAQWNEELGWDFGFVQISTDGGVTYQSIGCTDTTTDTDPDALPTAKNNVPGFTGFSAGWLPQTCSLSAYAGQTVLLAFRAFNDPATLGWDDSIPPGFWVDDVKIGTTAISDGSSVADWQSMTQAHPTTVSNYVVSLISIHGTGHRARVTVKQLRLDSGFEARTWFWVRRYIDPDAEFVGAVVSYQDPTEVVDQYAPYALTVNGVVQPGGN